MKQRRKTGEEEEETVGRKWGNSRRKSIPGEDGSRNSQAGNTPETKTS